MFINYERQSCLFLLYLIHTKNTYSIRLNPGIPLVKTERFIDSPPRSRNEALASFIRRIGVCEERGSGFDKVRACYLHACLKYVMRDHMTNTSLRERFGLDEKGMSSASRIIRDALEDGQIKPVDPNTASRYLKYIPHWA